MAQAGEKRPADFVKSGPTEGIKSHMVYDGSNRLSEVYEAMADALNGATALKTSYQYDGASTRITGMKEELSTWNSAWDF